MPSWPRECIGDVPWVAEPSRSAQRSLETSHRVASEWLRVRLSQYRKHQLRTRAEPSRAAHSLVLYLLEYCLELGRVPRVEGCLLEDLGDQETQLANVCVYACVRACVCPTR